jgi:D-alanyl-D-alanine carboxypeptidase
MTPWRTCAAVLTAVTVVLGGCAADGPPLSSATPTAQSTTGTAAETPSDATPALRAEALSTRNRPTRPRQPDVPVAFRPALVPDPCTDRDVPAPPAADPAMTILDRTYGLAADAVPPDLVRAAEAGFTGPAGARQVRAVVVDDLAAMRAAWREAGLDVTLDSAYRSHGAQAATFERWLRELGEGAALARSARPGHSEHQLGTAIDVSSPGWAGRFGDWGRDTPEGRWMGENAWRFGFVMSYPAGSESLTCFSYEPWHFRWIGRAAAEDQRASGLYLRQYLERVAGD